MKRSVIGIDVGGTNVKMGVVNAAGEITASNTFSTSGLLKNRDRLIEAMVCGCRELLTETGLKKKDVAGIGIGLPGAVNTAEGVVYYLPNIPGWHNVRLKRLFEKKLKIRAFLENDVNMITLGEWRFGAGAGARDMIGITLGTGVGGGLILDGRLYRGSGFVAGELGHMPLNEKGPKCSCGGEACLERYVGNRWLLEAARRRFGRAVTLEELNRLADRPPSGAGRGNRKAIGLWHDAAEKIGIGLSGVVNLLNPERIVIGGGVANAYRHLAPTIRQTIRRRAMKAPAKMVRIVKGRLGDKAGIIGARVLVGEHISQ